MVRNHRHERRPGALLMNIAILTTLAVFSPGWIYIIVTRYPLDAWVLAGIVIVAAASILLAVARIQLGTAFSLNARARVLVTTGLYSKLRHPVYVFGLLLFLGVMMTLKRFDGLFVWLVLLLLQIKRANTEDARLEETFGHDYLEYKAKTWF
jgi:protein-S-isoprenylcysteine O-methyltransferase Ste14